MYALLGYCHKIFSAHTLITLIFYGITMLKSALSSLFAWIEIYNIRKAPLYALGIDTFDDVYSEDITSNLQHCFK